MNLWTESHTRPLLIAHRGASAHAPENTLGAFALAMEQHADGIELDVKRCASGEVVVMHDHTVNRTTNGSGTVESLTLTQLRTLNAGAGERVPTLDEVLDLIRADAGFLINIEITNYDTPRDGLENEVIKIVQRHNFGPRVLYSSFNHLLVRRLAKLDPNVPRALLYWSKGPLYLRNVWLSPFIRHEFRHHHYGMVTPQFVSKMHASGKRVNAWTVNDEAQIRRMAAMGVDGIIGDSPVTMRHALALE
ncbi:MAG: glycerophosphodiester phosphodiesterase family protein [Chloroflexi bacterium]|nr:glycerophosphodiester phosphodiesterase family protein [Chloroflexota bacterium]